MWCHSHRRLLRISWTKLLRLKSWKMGYCGHVARKYCTLNTVVFKKVTQQLTLTGAHSAHCTPTGFVAGSLDYAGQQSEWTEMTIIDAARIAEDRWVEKFLHATATTLRRKDGHSTKLALNDDDFLPGSVEFCKRETFAVKHFLTYLIAYLFSYLTRNWVVMAMRYANDVVWWLVICLIDL